MYRPITGGFLRAVSPIPNAPQQQPSPQLPPPRVYVPFDTETPTYSSRAPVIASAAPFVVNAPHHHHHHNHRSWFLWIVVLIVFATMVGCLIWLAVDSKQAHDQLDDISEKLDKMGDALWTDSSDLMGHSPDSVPKVATTNRLPGTLTISHSPTTFSPVAKQAMILGNVFGDSASIGSLYANQTSLALVSGQSDFVVSVFNPHTNASFQIPIKQLMDAIVSLVSSMNTNQEYEIVSHEFTMDKAGRQRLNHIEGFDFRRVWFPMTKCRLETTKDVFPTQHQLAVVIARDTITGESVVDVTLRDSAFLHVPCTLSVFMRPVMPN